MTAPEKLLADELEHVLGSMCLPECEGRCKVCPADVARKVIAFLRTVRYEQ